MNATGIMKEEEVVGLAAPSLPLGTRLSYVGVSAARRIVGNPFEAFSVVDR